ncbi:hypothetical protein ACFSTD_04800 [Novosphingobium colocasiae]
MAGATTATGGGAAGAALAGAALALAVGVAEGVGVGGRFRGGACCRGGRRDGSLRRGGGFVSHRRFAGRGGSGHGRLFAVLRA